MRTPHRNQLVWLTEPAWQHILAQAWDAQALDILQHWWKQQLPLVVCRQRVPDSIDSIEDSEHGPMRTRGNFGMDSIERISLGLPAPQQWGRRKLALDMAADGIARVGDFPLMESLLRYEDSSNNESNRPGGGLSVGDRRQLQQLLVQLQALGVSLRVYGSYGWQAISGLPCVREGSDLDVLARVPDLATAARVTRLLQGLQLGPRVDGELLFPNGWAAAWREYAQLLAGQVDRVLVKQRRGVQLLGMAALEAEFSDAPSYA